MDTAGKDGAISHVMSGVNPQGCVVTSFKEPSSGELHHDFMWRSQLHLPRRGTIGIFNRSYYEDVLAPRVHRQVFDQQLLPEELAKPDDSFWKHRLKDIAHFESYLGRNGTRVVKFFLHLSKKEQARRLRDRLLADDKHWKVSQSDFRERGYWSEFQDAYQDCLRRSSTRECPWYVIPADDKKNARLIISHILVELMTEMPLRYPKPTADQERFIEEMTREMKG
jgi:PPK2 family polyphosphate:nucleotide phosphotransferase